jgi:hypothetical protein
MIGIPVYGVSAVAVGAGRGLFLYIQLYLPHI